MIRVTFEGENVSVIFANITKFAGLGPNQTVRDLAEQGAEVSLSKTSGAGASASEAPAASAPVSQEAAAVAGSTGSAEQTPKRPGRPKKSATPSTESVAVSPAIEPAVAAAPPQGAPAATPAEAPKAASPQPEAASAVSLEAVRAAFKELSMHPKGGGMNAVSALLKQFGVDKMSALPADKYAAVLAQVNAALAAANG